MLLPRGVLAGSARADLLHKEAAPRRREEGAYDTDRGARRRARQVWLKQSNRWLRPSSSNELHCPNSTDLYRISVQRPVPPFPARPGGGGPPGPPGHMMNPYGMPQQQPQYGYPGYGYPPQPYGMGPPVPGYIPPIPPGGYPGYPPMGMPQPAGPPVFPGHGMPPGHPGMPPGPAGGMPPGYPPGGPQVGGPPPAPAAQSPAAPSPPTERRQATPKSPEAEAPEQSKLPIPSNDTKPEPKPQSPPKRKASPPPFPEHKKPPTIAEEARAAAVTGQSPPFTHGTHANIRYDSIPPGAPPPPYNPNFPPYGAPPPGPYFQYPPMGGPMGPHQPPPMGLAQAGYAAYPPPTPQGQQIPHFHPGSAYQHHQPQPSPHSQHAYSSHPPTPQHQYTHAAPQQPPTPAAAEPAPQPKIEESGDAEEDGAPIPDDLDDVSSE